MKQIWREERYGGKKFELILLSLSPSILNHYYYLIMATRGYHALLPSIHCTQQNARNNINHDSNVMPSKLFNCGKNRPVHRPAAGHQPSIVLVLHTSSPQFSSHQLFTSSTVSQPCCGINTAFHFNSHYLRSEPLVWSRHGWNSSIQGMEVIHHGM